MSQLKKLYQKYIQVSSSDTSQQALMGYHKLLGMQRRPAYRSRLVRQ
ncbi:MAG: hypothetical protein JJT87_19795 [Halomonas sp.]|nr:hypothetical protein [Halomonas sp.]MCC5904161.1 hypothetical protein [Halomonas sp.]